MLINKNLFITTYLLFLFVKIGQSANCTKFKTCNTCTTGSDNILLPCFWCTKLHKCGNALEMAGSTDKTRITLPYECPVAPTSRNLYNDFFARTRVLPFIAATNTKDRSELLSCLKNNFYNVRVLDRITAPCDAALNECMAYLSYSPVDNAIVLVFRSTNSASQLLVESVDFLFQTQKDFQPVGGKVVSYFYDAFFALWNAGLEVKIRDAVQHYPKAELWIFGHSLGGSLASLASAWVSRLGYIKPERLKFMSFGQPRTGDINYAKAFDSLVPYKYRVVHRSDSITQMPMRLPFTSTNTFIHHRYEVFYKNEMEPKAKCVICLRAEDPNCSQGLTEPIDPQIHRHYFNTSLDKWAKDGCDLAKDYYTSYKGQHWVKQSRMSG